jgi:hypothetical protein
MKKSILIFCGVLLLSIVAYGFINRNDSKIVETEKITNEIAVLDKPAPEAINKNDDNKFIYDVGPRFRPIKKTDLDNAKSSYDFLDEKQKQAFVSLNSVEVIILINDKQSDIREITHQDELSEAQLQLLQSSKYSTNFLISARYQRRNYKTGEIEDSHSTPHLTIVPEKQAGYSLGKNSLMEYLRENSKESWVNIEEDKLKPAKLFFTITKKGIIENVRLDRSSNFPAVDEKMLKLINKVPGTWEPAENAKGEKVDQELVISFGLMGC